MGAASFAASEQAVRKSLTDRRVRHGILAPRLLRQVMIRVGSFPSSHAGRVTALSLFPTAFSENPPILPNSVVNWISYPAL
jgi:acid phosphatase family membrane protein YuiD